MLRGGLPSSRLRNQLLRVNIIRSYRKHRRYETKPSRFSAKINDFGGIPMVSTECESCWYYDYDEEFEEYYCMMDLDEDEVYRIISSRSQHCPYYRQGDDYTLARRQ